MTYKAAVIGLGRMGSTFDDEIEQGGSIFLPYCHAPTYTAHPQTELIAGADPHDEQREIFGDDAPTEPPREDRLLRELNLIILKKILNL